MSNALVTSGYEIPTSVTTYQRRPKIAPLIALRLSLIAPKAIASINPEAKCQFQNLDEFLADFDETFEMFQFVLQHLKSSDVSMATTVMDFINYTCNVEPNLTISEVILFVALWFVCDENPHRTPPSSDKGRPGKSRRERKSKYKIAEALVKFEQRQKAAQERNRTGGIWTKLNFWQLLRRELRRIPWNRFAKIPPNSASDLGSVSNAHGMIISKSRIPEKLLCQSVKNGRVNCKRPPMKLGHFPVPSLPPYRSSAGRTKNKENLPGVIIKPSERESAATTDIIDQRKWKFHNSQCCHNCRNLLQTLYPDLSRCEHSVQSLRTARSGRDSVVGKLDSALSGIATYRPCGLDVIRTSRHIWDLFGLFEPKWNQN